VLLLLENAESRGTLTRLTLKFNLMTRPPLSALTFGPAASENA